MATLLPSLPASLLSRIEVRHCGHLRVEDLIDVRPGEVAVVVDAAVGISPGHVVTLPIRSITSDGSVPTPRSSHEPPIDQVLGLAGALRPGGLPDGLFVGIGGRRFSYGRPLSRSVRLNMAAFQAAIADELSRLARRSPEELATSGG